MAWLIYWIFLATSVSASVFALARGGPPERAGAILRLSVLAIELPLQSMLILLHAWSSSLSGLSDLVATAAMSFGFLYIALKFGSNWLALAMMIQALQFYTNRLFLDSDTQSLALYSKEENIITIAVTLVLALATFDSIRRRKLRRLADAARAQRDQERISRIQALVTEHLSLPA
jgi:hypothetical protein